MYSNISHLQLNLSVFCPECARLLYAHFGSLGIGHIGRTVLRVERSWLKSHVPIMASTLTSIALSMLSVSIGKNCYDCGENAVVVGVYTSKTSLLHRSPAIYLNTSPSQQTIRELKSMFTKHLKECVSSTLSDPGTT